MHAYHILQVILLLAIVFVLFRLGLFNIVKLPRLNSLVSHMPDTLDLAFKLKRKKFTIEVRNSILVYVFVSQPHY